MFCLAGHGGGEGPDVSVVADAPPADIFSFLFTSALCKIIFANPRTIPYIAPMTWRSLPYEPRQVQATEARLDAIYSAARKGLIGDTLALAAGLLPAEYRRLCQFDPLAELAELKGRADGEMLASDQLHQAAAAGDAKAALDILKHVHGWVARQAIDVSVEQTISIKHALELAQQRVDDFTVIDGTLSETVDAVTSSSLLTKQLKEQADGSDDDYRR